MWLAAQHLIRSNRMITLPERTSTGIDSLTPREIVAELDKYVVGQAKAKRAVAIALRNRMRRQKLPADLAIGSSPTVRKRSLALPQRAMALNMTESGTTTTALLKFS